MTLIVLQEPNFPTVDTCTLPFSVIAAAAGNDYPVRSASVKELPAALSSTDDVFINPYGSTFPKAAWPAIYDFLRRGGGWLNLGGAPFTRPVRLRRDGSWHAEIPQTAYLKELRLNQAFPIHLLEEYNLPAERAYTEWATDLLGDAHLPDLPCDHAWSLQPRFTDTRDFPAEHGTGGARDASIRALLYKLDEHRRRYAAPIVEIDRLRGPFAGGRWVLVNAHLRNHVPEVILRALMARVAAGPVELDVRPTFACYYPGEQAAVVVRVKARNPAGTANLTLSLRRDGATLGEQQLGLDLTGSPTFRSIPLDARVMEQPGLLTLDAALEAGPSRAVTTTGFWIYDEPLLNGGAPLALDRDYFLRDGVPYPVTGTTYMAGDVHRKFLFEPNAAVWDRDFAAMKAAGVNMVRTGLWNSWKRAMLDPGAVDEGVLRAFTGFLLTARRHDIPVIFTFFAFTPEEWGGSNPYLDPRAVSAQKELVAAFAQRFALVNDLLWDLINEPSFSSPARTWSTRPVYDACERAAWCEWLRERAGSFAGEEASAAAPEDVWRERWRLTPNDPLDLPDLADFQDQHIFQGAHPIRALDYRLFAQEMFNRWVQELSAVIRANGNAGQWITVGQDEGGTADRPNVHFHADVVDFTCNHSWWQNDDLLWDSVITKTPNRPNLIEETGIMFAENIDGGFRRTPEQAANLLARKLALAYAAGCAGYIQWLWNTNVYMDSDNEVGIGLLRADGTEKPEMEAFRTISRFFQENARRMTGRRLEEVVVLIPHSNMFSVRDTATAATRRAVRTLEYQLGVATRAVSEYRVSDLGDPKLIVMPSPRVLTDACWDGLLKAVERGATLLVTGPVSADAYWRPADRQEELIYGTGERAVYSVYRVARGKGQVIYSPLPVELSDAGGAALAGLYRYACEAAGSGYQPAPPANGDLLVRKVEFDDAVLFITLAETTRGGIATVPFGGDGLSLQVFEDGICLVFADRATGEVLAQTRYP